jgi:hypothetical protein
MSHICMSVLSTYDVGHDIMKQISMTNMTLLIQIGTQTLSCVVQHTHELEGGSLKGFWCLLLSKTTQSRSSRGDVYWLQLFQEVHSWGVLPVQVRYGHKGWTVLEVVPCQTHVCDRAVYVAAQGSAAPATSGQD